MEEINETIPIVITSRSDMLKLSQHYSEEEEAVNELVFSSERSGCKSVGILGEATR
jgi:hypothetical protein